MKKKSFYIHGLSLLALLFWSSTDLSQAAPAFAKGADVGWLSQMESQGRVFQDEAGTQKPCLQILQEHCINTIRLRVWVNPTGGWCGKTDVINMAVRAKNMGFRILIDFHYSDSWADPGQQTKPAAWATHNITQLVADVAAHTTDVLTGIQAAGVTPEWVQVGNETNDGMLWNDGRASTNMANFAALVDSGYGAVKAVFPSAKVIVHISNGYDNALFRWIFDGLRNNGARWDVCGMSLYPDPTTWTTLDAQCLTNMNDMVSRYNKDVMIVEIGMDVASPQPSFDFITDITTKTQSVAGGRGLGVVWWEPEAYNWMGYNKVCFGTNMRPTTALSAFGMGCSAGATPTRTSTSTSTRTSTRTNTPNVPTATRTNTPVPPTATRSMTPTASLTASRTNTQIVSTPTRTSTPSATRTRTSTPAGPLKVMPLGDSITGSPGCWRSVLWNRLQTSGCTNVDFVGSLSGQGCPQAYDSDGEGHGGFLVTNVASGNQLPPWLTAADPDIVMMHFGTNDVWNNIAPQTILAAYTTLVNQMRAQNPNMIILVAQILPMDPLNTPTCPTCACPACPGRVTTLNGLIPAWAAGLSTPQSPIIVVDQWTGFNVTTDTIDGVHPNDTGNQKMSDKWYPALASALGCGGGATPTRTNTPIPPTATRTNTLVPPTATRTSSPTASRTSTPVPPTPTRTNTPVPPTSTLTRTNTPVPPTATPTRTNSPLPPTSTSTLTRTNTPVPPTQTSTNTLAPATSTPTLTRSMTPTASSTPAPPTSTSTGTRTNTPVPPSSTSTSSATRTNTPIPPSATSTLTRTSTLVPPTSTSTLTRTNTLVPPTQTSTNTPVLATSTPTLTRSMTPTASSTPVPPTSTPTLTPSPTCACLATFTSTLTPTGTSLPPSATPSATASQTSTGTATPTSTRTNTPLPPPPTSTPTSTDTQIPPTLTSTSTRSMTPTASFTLVPSTPTPTLTSSPTATDSATGTPSPVPTGTRTSTASATTTPSSTNTLVSTPTSTTTSTRTPTLVPTLTPTSTSSMTPTTTLTASLTTTSTATLTNTLVNTQTNTSTPTTSSTTTSTASLTSTKTATLSSTPTSTASNTPTLAPTSTSTSLPTATLTSTSTVQPTVTLSPTATVQAGSTPIVFPNPISTGIVEILPQIYPGSQNVMVQIYTNTMRMVGQKTFPLVQAGTTVKMELLDDTGEPLANGVYYVYVTVNNTRRSTTLVISR